MFSTGGDGFAVVFDDVGDAVVSALEVQAALADDPLRVRIGIHVGRAVERDADYFGPTLNRAARLMAVGHGGQVLLSEVAGALARSALPEGVALLDLGTHQLRDLTRPERIWQLQTADTPAFPGLRSVGVVATNLPVIEELVGREIDTRRVVELARARIGSSRSLARVVSGRAAWRWQRHGGWRAGRGSRRVAGGAGTSRRRIGSRRRCRRRAPGAWHGDHRRRAGRPDRSPSHAGGPRQLRAPRRVVSLASDLRSSC